MTGTYQMHVKKLWPEFPQRVPGAGKSPAWPKAQANQPRWKPPSTTSSASSSLVRVFAITSAHVDDFIATARRQDPGQKKGSLVSPATVNHDLRALSRPPSPVRSSGATWRRCRSSRWSGESRARLPLYATGDHFAAIYAACETARMPEDLPYPAADWWRGLLVLAYMTGWRIGDMLGLRREDLDLEGGYAVSRRWEENKGKRDDQVKLHPVIIDHLKRIPALTPTVFPLEPQPPDP